VNGGEYRRRSGKDTGPNYAANTCVCSTSIWAKDEVKDVHQHRTAEYTEMSPHPSSNIYQMNGLYFGKINNGCCTFFKCALIWEFIGKTAFRGILSFYFGHSFWEKKRRESRLAFIMSGAERGYLNGVITACEGKEPRPRS
jgi:hypothetical protein